MQRPDLCKNCKKHCCKRPALTTDEYIRLFTHVGNDVIQKHKPMLMGNVWMFDEEGCPGLTDKGCIMPYEERPLMCRLYPWIAVPILGTRQKDAYTDLLLYTTTCPQWKAFGDDYDIARKEFENG